MFGSLIAWLQSCTLQAPQRPLAGLSAAELERAAVVLWDKQDPGGTFLVDDAAAVAANAGAVALRDGKLNLAGSSSARFEFYVFVDGALRTRAHASQPRGLELGTLRAAAVPAEHVIGMYGRDAYRAERARLLGEDRVLFVSDPHPLAADVLTHETSLALPPMLFAADRTPDALTPNVLAAELEAVRRAIRRRAAEALAAAGADTFVIVAPDELSALPPHPVADRAAPLDEYDAPVPLRGADGQPLTLAGVHVVRAHLAVRSYAADTARVAALDREDLVRAPRRGAAASERLDELAAREGWSAERRARVAPADVVAYERSGSPEPRVRELTWLLSYFRRR